MRSQTLLFAVFLTLVHWSPLLPAARAQTDPGTLMAQIDASRALPPADGNFHLQGAPDPTTIISRLGALVTDLDHAAQRSKWGPLPKPFFLDAAQQFRMALDYSTAATPDLDAAVEAIGLGVAPLAAITLPRSQFLHEEVAALSNRAAAVARQFADPIVERAAAGDNLEVAEEARAAIDLGDLALFQGDVELAVALFRQGLNLAANVVTFHVDAFEQNIRDALVGRAVGYAYSIGDDGGPVASGAFGEARTGVDSPQLLQSPSKEMFSASMTKTLSAVALLKALADAGIPLEAKVTDYLPPDWVRGPRFDEVTFKELLTHRSGLDTALLSRQGLSGQTFATLQAVVAAGSLRPADPTVSPAYTYTNANFSLMRILVPYIAIDPLVIANWENVWDPDAVYAAWYSIYVDENVLSPAGVNKITCAPVDPEPTLLYSLSNPGPGHVAGPWMLSCGATGWFLSAEEWTSFLAFLRFTNDILASATRDLMDDLFLGWLDPQGTFGGAVTGKFGPYRGHAGDFTGSNITGMNGCIMNFPIGVQASLLINSKVNNPTRACITLRDAYDDAFF